MNGAVHTSLATPRALRQSCVSSDIQGCQGVPKSPVEEIGNISVFLWRYVSVIFFKIILIND